MAAGFTAALASKSKSASHLWRGNRAALTQRGHQSQQRDLRDLPGVDDAEIMTLCAQRFVGPLSTSPSPRGDAAALDAVPLYCWVPALTVTNQGSDLSVVAVAVGVLGEGVEKFPCHDVQFDVAALRFFDETCEGLLGGVSVYGT